MIRHALRRRLANDRGAGDRGLTLTELVVVMMILGIIVAATATLAIGFGRTNAENISRQDQIDAARTAVERMSKTTRTAVKPSQITEDCSVACNAVEAFVSGTKSSIAFYANLDNEANAVGPSRVTYSVGTSGDGAGVLVEKVLRPVDQNLATDAVDPGSNGYVYCDAESPTATEACKSHLTIRVLAEGVQTDGAIFRYYGPTGDELPLAAGALSTANLAKVLSIELTVTVQSINATKPQPTTYIQRVTLPNAQAVLRQGKDDD